MSLSDPSEFAVQLTRLGVDEETLSPSEKRALDEAGYLLFPNVLDRQTLDELRAEFERAYEEERKSEGDGTQGETGTRHLARLVEANPACRQILIHPKLLASAYHIFQRPFIAVDIHGRDPLPGYGEQGIHTDWQPRSPSDPYSIVTAIFLLDDFTEQNGSTHLVPGSHLIGGKLGRSYAAPGHRHPEEVVITASAGSVLIFNGHMLHGGRKNESQVPRRTLRCTLLGGERVSLVPFDPSELSPIPEHARFVFLPWPDQTEETP